MRKRILEHYLQHATFCDPQFAPRVAEILIEKADEGDVGARLTIRQAEARHATTMFRDHFIKPLMDLKQPS